MSYASHKAIRTDSVLDDEDDEDDEDEDDDANDGDDESDDCYVKKKKNRFSQAFKFAVILAHHLTRSSFTSSPQHLLT